MRKFIIKLLKKNERIDSIITWFNRWRAVRQLKRIKRKAEWIRKELNSQVFVVKMEGRVTFLTKKQFKEMRAKKVFPKQFTADSLKRISLYYTA